VKLALLDTDGKPLWSRYERHRAELSSALAGLLEGFAEWAAGALPGARFRVRVTGSGGIGISERTGLPFVQEVVATALAVRHGIPDADVAIELGGEDAKITYFAGGLEQRMNGSCAGGTGAFIDQMASLLRTDAAGLDALARGARTLYPIAARCGVFAKSDVQPLLNEGARREDIAASVLRAVVTQTVSGLACGKPIRGRVAFLGGPLAFLPELRRHFVEGLRLRPEDVRAPTDAMLYPAIGAALDAAEGDAYRPEELLALARKNVSAAGEGCARLKPLFESPAELEAFRERHARAKAPRARIEDCTGPVYVGIDAGSTTTKAVAVDQRGAIAWSAYRASGGEPLTAAAGMLRDLYSRMGSGAYVARSCVTGYGEAFMRAALKADEGEVETIAHYRAAREYLPDVDAILDIGGQDMKFLRIRDGAVSSILLNEACSSGCGSFLEGFAAGLGLSPAEFSERALRSKAPADLGSRCTVFMNSRVKQAQKEGASVADIAAGLSVSVVKNALQKVIRLARPEDIGRRVIVQGGTMLSDAVLRAFERQAGVEAVRPDSAGIMGAWGAALLARDKAGLGARSGLLSADELENLNVTSERGQCGLCANDCPIQVMRFSDGRAFVSGNRCERGARAAGAESAVAGRGERMPNLYAWKYARLFKYRPLAPEEAPRGSVGIPRVLNIFDSYPFWHRYFSMLGFRALLSPPSSKAVYEAGIESIPSESVCYPGKLVHGHIEKLIEAGADFIFYPCLPYSPKEDPGANNHFNCPIVASYPEVVLNNVEGLREGRARFLNPFLPYDNPRRLAARLAEELAPWGVGSRESRRAVAAGLREMAAFRAELRRKAERLVEDLARKGGRGIVLAGRPYHVDPEISHGIAELACELGWAVLPEDSVSHLGVIERPLRVVDQWVYHSRLYAAAHFVAARPELELVQLTSFGCGLDAVTADQVAEILESRGRMHTLIKIDEHSNLGAVRIRLRSLLAAQEARRAPKPGGAVRELARRALAPARRVLFTERMRETHTILAPQMSPIHFRILEEAFRLSRYRLEVLPDVDPGAVDAGLAAVNNDACYPSIIVVGQMMEALRSGRYDLSRTALLITQTGGGCRATNYIAFIRKALADAGLSHVPVISLSAQGLERNPGFKIDLGLARRSFMALCYGDLLMRLLYATRPYEIVPGSASALADESVALAKRELARGSYRGYARLMGTICARFDSLPIREERKPRVGVVGEILVKFHPTANNGIVDLIEAEGAEAVVPDLTDFLLYSLYGGQWKRRFLAGSLKGALVSRIAIAFIEHYRAPLKRALARSARFSPPLRIEELARGVDGIVQLGNSMGEGWFLTAEMVELIHSGVMAIACIQPFACLPNHVTGKGMIKELRRRFPGVNIAAIDYDPGASEANQINRLKLLLAQAKGKL
jgi:predicted CoA-substrate-specific enzyme activase